jgi:DNA-directed RNA polymerase subunit M/transcription elongation factor TFIIS
MKFCELCDNTLYIRVIKDRDQQRLEHYCKFCGATQQAGPGGDTHVCVLETYIQDEDDNDWRRYMTPYLKYDPTLPRRDNIPCPNQECKASSSPTNQVIVVKYDEVNMKFLYCCETCGHFWRTVVDK